MSSYWSRVLLSIGTVLFTCQVSEAGAPLTANSTCLSPPCYCFGQRKHISAKCAVTVVADIQRAILKPQYVVSLDLSSNAIKYLPFGVFINFTQVRNMSLANNSIHFIKEGTFKGLHNLVALDLSNNPMRQWVGDIYKDLTSIQRIDVTGNSQWIPGTSFLQLTTLKEIKGASWNERCNACTLVRNVSSHSNADQTKRCQVNEDFARGTCTVCNPVRCTCVTHYFSNTTVTLSHYGFVFARCKDGDECRGSLSRKVVTNPCIRSHIIPFALTQCPVGIIGIILNLLALVNIFTTQPLRNNIPMLLSGNMAFCDLLTCIYSFSTALVHATIPYNSFMRNIKSICLPVGVLWFLGVSVSTLTSTLITIERYLVIVFAMKPFVRMRRKHALICLLCIWLFCLSLAVFAVLEEYSTHNSFCIPGSSVSSSPKHMKFNVSGGSLGVALFITSTILYIHIYIVVRRSRRAVVTNKETKKEANISMRIALLVFSNMAFFFLPTVLTLVLTLSGTYPKIQADGSGDIWKVAAVMYFSSISYNLNSFLNPLWYTYRNDKFKRALKGKFILIYNVIFGRY